jgi:membrane-associated protein
MEQIWDFLSQLTNPRTIIEYGGLILLCAVVFTENGLFFGFFFPGDSLLFTAGLLTATHVLAQPLVVVLVAVFLSAVIGSFVGYYFGFKTGNTLFNRKDSFFFRKSHLKAAADYYEKHGARTLVVGRFLPVIRTFAPIVAGMIRMPIATFTLANLAGAALWVFSLISIGFFVGTKVPNAEQYLGYIVIGLVVITAIPVVTTIMKNKKKSGSKGDSSLPKVD